MSRSQRGVALIQVLLIGGIIGLLMLQLGLTAREQLRRAAALEDRAEAQLRAASLEAELLYELLTRVPAQVARSQEPLLAVWNFRGQPFEWHGATFRIQDQSGLYRVPLYGSAGFVALLERLGVGAERARRLGDELARLQLGPGAGAATGSGSDSTAFPVQTPEDLLALPSMDHALFERLRPLLTLYPTPGLNPLTAPPELLVLRFPPGQAAALAELRAAGRLDEQAVYRLTGVEADEVTVFAPGPAFSVETRVRLGDVEVRREVTYVVRPYQGEAVGVWQRKQVGRG